MTVISYLTRTHFAEQAIEDALPEEVRGVRRALLFVDASEAARRGAERVRAALQALETHVVEALRPMAQRGVVGGLAAWLTESSADVVIAIGGVGCVGQARLVCETVARDRRAPRLVAVPAGLFDLGLAPRVRPSDGEPAFPPRPDLIIADPSTLESVPAADLAAGGMETLVHAIEAFASPGFNPPADALAMDAARRLSRWLPAVDRAAEDATVRRELLAGALTAGLALEKAVGGVDALADPLEQSLDGARPAGALHAPLLAAFAGFNAPAVGDRYAALADAVEARSSGALGERMRALSVAVGLPGALREAGVDRSRFPAIARAAADDPGALANPRRLSAKDCADILEAAW